MSSFLGVWVIGTYIVFSNLFLDTEVNRYAIDVFDSLLIFLTATMGINEASKKIRNKVVPPETHPYQETEQQEEA